MARELEVKILNIDMEKMEKKIIELNGELIGKEVQVNTLIDTLDKKLEKTHNAYMRIREVKDLINNTRKIKFTLKKSISNNEIRDNLETTTEISDKQALIKILNTMGYFVYQEGIKERRSYRLENSRIDLDTWDKKTYPFPYMEIEVKNKLDLNRVIELLDIPEENISTKSILDLRRDLNLE